MKWNSYANNVRVIGLFPAFRSLPHTEKKQFVALQPHNKGNFVWYYVQYLAVQQKIIWTNDVELSQNLFCTICSQFFSFFLIKSPKRHSSLFSACRKKNALIFIRINFSFLCQKYTEKDSVMRSGLHDTAVSVWKTLECVHFFINCEYARMWRTKKIVKRECIVHRSIKSRDFPHKCWIVGLAVCYSLFTQVCDMNAL